MGVMGYISRVKSGFREAQFKKQEALALSRAEELRIERDRQAKLAMAQAEKVRLERDVANIRGFTEKHREMTKAQKFGQGLAKVVNQAKKHASTSGIKIGAPRSSVGSGIQQQTRNVFGGRPLETGGSGPSPFTMGRQDKPKPERRPKVTIQL